jgi:hypothetical protein
VIQDLLKQYESQKVRKEIQKQEEFQKEQQRSLKMLHLAIYHAEQLAVERK